MTNASRTTGKTAEQATPLLDSPMRAMWLLNPGQFELRQQPIYEVGPGQVRVENLISHLLPLENLQQGVELVKNQEGFKVMAEIGGETV